MGMDNAQILSAITGKPVEDVRDDMNRLEKSNRMGFDFLQELKKASKNNIEYASLIQSHITMMIDEFTVETRALILMKVAKLSLTGKVEEADKLFKKFKQNGKKKITNTR